MQSLPDSDQVQQTASDAPAGSEGALLSTRLDPQIHVRTSDSKGSRGEPSCSSGERVECGCSMRATQARHSGTVSG